MIVTTLFYKIPPHLPLPAFGREEQYPSLTKRAKGDFMIHANLILKPLVYRSN
jgi:hypothetical protein